LIFIVYVALVVVLILGWQRAIRKQKVIELKDGPFISIIIPTRNEENNIASLLNDISSQSYKHFEVIVVDDHSQDSTVEKVSQEMKKDGRITSIRSNGVGKKRALTAAIHSSKGAIVITTDADCRVKANWLASLIPYFSDLETKVVFGGVRISGKTFFDDAQALEFASLIGSGGATAALGFPTMCNGANLAFRKDVFDEVGGYSGNLEIPSGDDEFLMRKVKSRYPKGIVFAGKDESVVSTAPGKDVNEFIQQRIRWAGKWKHNASWSAVLLAVFIFCFQLSNITVMTLLVLQKIDPIVGSFLLWIKVLVEYIFLREVSHFLQIRWRWSAFAILQVLYPFYVVTIGLLSNFLSFSWKGRTLKSLTVNN
jgi:poly-beta-1,6-N-acetyl-D-glucosamine synthase